LALNDYSGKSERSRGRKEQNRRKNSSRFGGKLNLAMGKEEGGKRGHLRKPMETTHELGREFDIPKMVKTEKKRPV
jgi:hypothetical protein